MSLAVVVGDILSCRAWCSLGDQAAVNSYNYKCISVTGGAITDQDLCDSFDFLAETFYKGWMAATATYDGIQTYFTFRPTLPIYPAFVKTTTNAGPGTTAGPVVPPNSAAILAYTTNIRGPSGRGRVFLPFAASAQVGTDGTLTVGATVFANSYASTLLPPLTITIGGSSATFVWSLIHRHPKPAPPTDSQITSSGVTAKFGQMHKRGSYGRPNASPI